MSVPAHGPFCQTKTYPTRCKDCAQDIFLLQCSCGSIVLFDELGWPWSKHICAGRAQAATGVGVGGTGALWTVTDELQDIFEDKVRRDRDPTSVPESSIVEPTEGASQTLLAVLRELRSNSHPVARLNNMPAAGVRLLGMNSKEKYWQTLLVDNGVRPNEHYSALAPHRLVADLKPNVMVMADLEAQVHGDWRHWVVKAIHAI